MAYVIYWYQIVVDELTEKNDDLRVELWVTNEIAGVNSELELYKGLIDTLTTQISNSITKTQFLSFFTLDTVCYLESVDSCSMYYPNFEEIYQEHCLTHHSKTYNTVYKIIGLPIYYLFNNEVFVGEISSYHKANEFDLKFYIHHRRVHFTHSDIVE